MSKDDASLVGLCVTCGKRGGSCRWVDDAEACMRRQLEALRAAEWKPIDTAPKTTLARLVWCPERKNIHLVSWSHNQQWEHFGGLGRALTEEPTHWMPLPEPPGGAA